jgi:branched-chain amino acid transport system permease protein
VTKQWNRLKQLVSNALADPGQAFWALSAATIVAGAVFVLFPNTVTFLLTLAVVLAIHLSALNRTMKVLLWAVLILLVIPIGGVEQTAFLNLSVQIFIAIALALGLNLVVGFSGLLDLGYVAFFAAGAYLWAIFGSAHANEFMGPVFGVTYQFPVPGWAFWLFIPLALGIAALFGLALGIPVLRLKGDYLAIVTLGFGEIIRLFVQNFDHPVNFTNGPRGISAVAAPEIFGFKLDNLIYYYFIGLVLVVAVSMMMSRLQHSRIGRAWAAMREDEIAARAMGVNLLRMKLLAFATGAAFAGVMGMVFVAKQDFVSPESFTFLESVFILAMVILGGMGSVQGAIIGAVLVTVLKLQVLKDLASLLGKLDLPNAWNLAKYQPLLLGIILIVMMIKRPEGILPPKVKKEDIAALEAAVVPGHAGGKSMTTD